MRTILIAVVLILVGAAFSNSIRGLPFMTWLPSN